MKIYSLIIVAFSVFCSHLNAGVATSEVVIDDTLLPNLQISNRVGAGIFDDFTDYQLLLFQSGGGPRLSYGLGIENGSFSFHSGGNLAFFRQGVLQMMMNNGRAGFGVFNPVAPVQIRNNVGANAFDDFTDYQLLLFQSGSGPRFSYGMGIESGFMALQSGAGYKFYGNGSALLTMSGGNTGIGTATPLSTLQLKNNVGANAFDDFTDYQLLLFQSGSGPRLSYGMGVEAGNMSFNSGGGYKFYSNSTTPNFEVQADGDIVIGRFLIINGPSIFFVDEESAKRPITSSTTTLSINTFNEYSEGTVINGPIRLGELQGDIQMGSFQN